MKIKLLYNPRYNTDVNDSTNQQQAGIPFLPPLGIATLTSLLQANNFHVEQDDLMIKVAHHNLTRPHEPLDIRAFCDKKRIANFAKTKHDSYLENIAEKMLRMTKTDGFDIFGFSIYDTHDPSAVGILLVLSKLLKERYDATIIVGGIIHDEVGKFLLDSHIIDYQNYHNYLFSPGDVNFLHFCKDMENGKEIPSGVICVRNGKIINTSVPPISDPPFVTPTFEGLPLEIYQTPISYKTNDDINEYRMLVLPYYFMKGCPNKCAFCANSVLPYWKVKNPSQIAEDLKYLSKKYKTPYFFFVNPTINPTPLFVKELANCFKESDVNILWTDCANFKGLDKNLIIQLRKMGATRLVFGLESASQNMLDYLGKGFSIQFASDMLKEVYNNGIWAGVDVICGFPYEKLEDIKDTTEFINKNCTYIQEISLFKFWLEGKFFKYPDQYGIVIREEKKEKTSREGNRIVFDEANGMKWEEKVKQIDEHYLIIRACLDIIYKDGNSTFSRASRIPDITQKKINFLHFIEWWNNPRKKWNGKTSFTD